MNDFLDDAIIINSQGKLLKKSDDFTIGFTVKEVIGISIINPRGISKLLLPGESIKVVL